MSDPLQFNPNIRPERPGEGSAAEPIASYLATILSGIDKKLNAAKAKGSPEEVEMARAELDKFIMELTELPSIEEDLKKENSEKDAKDALLEKAKQMLKKESSAPYLNAPSRIVRDIISFIREMIAKFFLWFERMMFGGK